MSSQQLIAHIVLPNTNFKLHSVKSRGEIINNGGVQVGGCQTIRN